MPLEVGRQIDPVVTVPQVIFQLAPVLGHPRPVRAFPARQPLRLESGVRIGGEKFLPVFRAVLLPGVLPNGVAGEEDVFRVARRARVAAGAAEQPQVERGHGMDLRY